MKRLLILIPALLVAVGLFVAVAPDKFKPIAMYLGIGPSVPNCSSETTADILFEIFSKQVLEVSRTNSLSRNDFRLRGVTTNSSENQNGRFFPTKFTCEAYLDIHLPSKALDAVSQLKKQKQAVSNNPMALAMGLWALLPNLAVLEGASEINVDGNQVSQSIQYTTQMDDELKYQSVTALGMAPVASVVGFLSDNGLFAENEKTSNRTAMPPADAPPQTNNAVNGGTDSRESVVKDILVEGRYQTTKESLADALGVSVGDSMSAFDAAAAQARIEHLPFVASVIVERRMPDTIYVHLTEIEPHGMSSANADTTNPQSPSYPQTLANVISASDWKYVNQALSFAYSLGEQKHLVQWTNAKANISGGVIQSGIGADENGCRQFRVTNKSKGNSFGYVDVCPGGHVK